MKKTQPAPRLAAVPAVEEKANERDAAPVLVKLLLTQREAAAALSAAADVFAAGCPGRDAGGCFPAGDGGWRSPARAAVVPLAFAGAFRSVADGAVCPAEDEHIASTVITAPRVRATRLIPVLVLPARDPCRARRARRAAHQPAAGRSARTSSPCSRR